MNVVQSLTSPRVKRVYRREGKPLLPCPFCGGEARMNTVKGDEAPIYWADCPDCGATKRTACTTARDAAKAWNDRRRRAKS